MSDDENGMKQINDDEISDTGHMLVEPEGDKAVCFPKIREKGKGKVDAERVRQTSTGSTRESSSHRTNLNINASYPEGGMSARISGRHHIQRGESGNVQEDPKVVRCCDGGNSNHEQMHNLSEGETQDPSTSPATLEADLQVPDGGWGWLVALGTFIIMTLYQSIDSFFGIFFSGYLLEKGTSSAATAWVFNIQKFVKNIIAPLIRPLAKEFGWRRIGCIGVFMSSFSVILSAFSPSAEFLFFSHSLLSGLGVGLMVGISYIILPVYFDRRRGLANTFLTAGTCLGHILIPPFIRYLLDNYRYKGGALIYGAMLMNGFVGVSLFHPVEWHMKLRRKTDQPPESLAPLMPQKERSDGPQKPMNLLDVVPQHEGTQEESDWLAVADQVKVKRTRRDTSHQLSECSQESVISNILSGNIVSDTNCAPPDNKEGYKGNRCLGVIKTLWIILVRVAHKTKSDVGILRSSRVFIISLANTLIFSSYYNFIMMVPFVMESEGHSLQDSAWGMSVMGICNLATLLILSPLSDWKRFDKRLCIMFGCVIMGSAILVFSFVTDLVWIIVASAASGHSLGATTTFYTLVMIQYLGIENLAAMFGVSSLMQGCGFLIIGPAIGFIRDKSGSYAVSLWALAAMPFVAFTLWLFMPAAVACDNRKR